MKYSEENTETLKIFVDENDAVFRFTPKSMINALIEITGSKLLQEFLEDFVTAEGVVDMCAGIEHYGKLMEAQGEARGEARERVKTQAAEARAQAAEAKTQAAVARAHAAEAELQALKRMYHLV